MQLSQAVASLEAAVDTQLSVASPEAAELGSQLMAALQPAIQKTFMDVLCTAAEEISSQLTGYLVEVKLINGEPELVVISDHTPPPPPPPPGPDDDEARITLRLPGYLKELIAEAASDTGDSVNAFVVDALRNQTYTIHTGKRGKSVKTTVDL